MASVVLSAAAPADQLYANSLKLGGGGLTSVGNLILGADIQVRPPFGEALIEIVARDGVNAASLHWEQSSLVPPVAMDMNLLANGQLTMNPYGGAGNALITIGDPRASVGPPALLANSEIFGFTSAFQAGFATIAAGTDSVAVVNTNITPTSIVLAHITELFDATLTAVQVGVVAGNGFTILGNANATAAVSVAYFVVRY